MAGSAAAGGAILHDSAGGRQLKSYAQIARLVWPLALGMLNNAVMQFVDRVFLSMDSLKALEAVLPASMLSWIFIGFFQGIVTYSGVVTARCFGAGDASGVLRSCRSGICIALLSGVAAWVMLPVGDWVFAATSSSPALAVLKKSYYDIVLGGSVFLYLHLAIAGYFTGINQTGRLVAVNLAGNLVNVALDPLLIFGWGWFPRLGIAGAAWATVIASAVQFAALFAMLRGRFSACGWREILRFGDLWPMIRQTVKYGLPAGGYNILNLLSFTIFLWVAERAGDMAFAVSNACFSINYLLIAPMEGFALGAQTLVSQSIGAGDAHAARGNARRVLMLGLLFSLCVLSVVMVWHREVLALFATKVEADAEFHALGITLMIFMCAWQFFDTADIILGGALKGAGDTHFVFLWMMVAAFAIWLPVVGIVAVNWLTMPALWATIVFEVVVVFAGSWLRWRRLRLRPCPEQVGTPVMAALTC